MARSQRGSDNLSRKGPWSPGEDRILISFILTHGRGPSWNIVPRRTGLLRSGQSCRIRWNNYLRPDLKRGKFSEDEESLILELHSALGNKWSRIACHLPGRADTEIKNFWNTQMRKKLLSMGIDPTTHRPVGSNAFEAVPFLGLLDDFRNTNHIDLKQLDLDTIVGLDFHLGQKIDSEPSVGYGVGLDLVQEIDSEPSVGNGLGLGMKLGLDLISWPVHPRYDSEPSVGNDFMGGRNSLSPGPCNSDGDSDSRYIEVFTRILRRGRG